MWTPTAACVAPGPARDEADPGPAGELPVRLRRVRSTLLVAARDEPDRRVVERVEHRQVALAREAEREVGAVQLELVDEDAAAGPHSGNLEEDGRALEPRLVLVAGVDVADRPLARPLGGQEQDTDERGVLGRRGGRETGSSAPSNHASPARYVRDSPSPRSIVSSPWQDPADPGPGCTCR